MSLDKAAEKLERLADDIDKLEKNYNELLMAVARVFPGETRHQTALRYIREREQEAMRGDNGCVGGSM